MELPLDCSDCGAPLLSGGELGGEREAPGAPDRRLACPECGASHGVDEFGVVHLKDRSYDYEQTHSSTVDLAAEVRSMTRDKFFDPATRDRLEREYEEFGVRYCLDTHRFAWTKLEPVAGKVVLDLGCGFGGASVLAARRGADLVLSVDGNLGRIRFLAAWAEKEGLDGILPLHANIRDLSLRPDTVDLCIMSGSLEWVGALGGGGDPEEAQRRALRRVRESLRPSGTLLVAIENRFAAHHFFGYRAHRVEPPFTTVLPRRLADRISRIVAGRPFNTYTYSLGGYRRLLRGCGFDRVDFYYPLPGYQHPAALLSSVEEGPLRDALSGWHIPFPKSVLKPILILLSRLGAARWFVMDYVIRGRPGAE